MNFVLGITVCSTTTKTKTINNGINKNKNNKSSMVGDFLLWLCERTKI